MPRNPRQGPQLTDEGETGGSDQDQAQWRPALRSLAHWVRMAKPYKDKTVTCRGRFHESKVKSNIPPGGIPLNCN